MPLLDADVPKKGNKPTLSFSSRRGRLQNGSLDVRAMVIDADFYNGIKEELHREYASKAPKILFQMGVGYGRLMARKIKETGRNKISVYRQFTRRGSDLGMGKFSIPLLKSMVLGLSREGVVRVDKSFFADAAGKTGKAECHILRGVMAGAAGELFGGEYECSEEKCTSKGDARCEFVLRQRRD